MAIRKLLALASLGSSRASLAIDVAHPPPNQLGGPSSIRPLPESTPTDSLVRQTGQSLRRRELGGDNRPATRLGIDAPFARPTQYLSQIAKKVSDTFGNWGFLAGMCCGSGSFNRGKSPAAPTPLIESRMPMPRVDECSGGAVQLNREYLLFATDSPLQSLPLAPVAVRTHFA